MLWVNGGTVAVIPCSRSIRYRAQGGEALREARQTRLTRGYACRRRRGGREQQIARGDEDKCDVCRKIRSLDRLVGLDWEGEDYSGGGAVRGSGKQ